MCARYQLAYRKALKRVKKDLSVSKKEPNISGDFGIRRIRPLHKQHLQDAGSCCCQILLRSTHSRFHFIKEHVENGVIELYFVNTEYQLADIFTKALGRERIEFLINKLGMRSFTPETLKKLADDVDE
ncbi:hypothetical protein Tco_0105543 [Tanacetum coccineum]